MPFELETIVPWGRSFDEYCQMFGLSESNLSEPNLSEPESRRILGCGDGPASFNAEATRRGYSVTSCDPLYRFSAADIEARIQTTYDKVMQQVTANQDAYRWQTLRSPAHLGEVRMAAMREFLEDYEKGKAQGRYLDAQLPQLPFGRQFDLALSSHLLFTYTAQLSAEFHLASILELCRVATEVRIFPLVDLAGCASAYVEPITSALQRRGYAVAQVETAYEFQKGARTLMLVSTSGQSAASP